MVKRERGGGEREYILIFNPLAPTVAMVTLVAMIIINKNGGQQSKSY